MTEDALPYGEERTVMQNIKTKAPYPCTECGKGDECTNRDCKEWREWLKEAWAVVTAEVKAADERSRG